MCLHQGSTRLLAVQESRATGNAESSSPAAEPQPSIRTPGGSCLGPDLLNQLAELSLTAAQMKRNHPSQEPVLSPHQVRKPQKQEGKQVCTILGTRTALK